MRLRLPSVWAEEATPGTLGVLRQLLAPEKTLEGTLVPFRREKDDGHVLLDSSGTGAVQIFNRKPRTAVFGADDRVLLCSPSALTAEEADLTNATWLSHPLLVTGPQPMAQLAAATRNSWIGAFQFAEEDVLRGGRWLRAANKRLEAYERR